MLLSVSHSSSQPAIKIQLMACQLPLALYKAWPIWLRKYMSCPCDADYSYICIFLYYIFIYRDNFLKCFVIHFLLMLVERKNPWCSSTGMSGFMDTYPVCLHTW